MLYHSCNHYTVPTSQSGITVLQSDDNQPRQDDQSGRVEHTNGSYVSMHVFYNALCGTLKW